jgi:hypothetical protein
MRFRTSLQNMRIEKRVQEIYSFSRDLSEAAEGGIKGPVYPARLARALLTGCWKIDVKPDRCGIGYAIQRIPIPNIRNDVPI